MTSLPDRAARHSRQVRCASIGEAGQRGIRQGHVLIVGVGALGTHTADALLRAGVGKLTLVDRDIVETSNLQRQVLFDEADARQGRPKATAAAERLRSVDSHCDVRAIVDDFGTSTWDDLTELPDIVVDGTDNFGTRLLINDLCLRADRPWIYGAAIGTTGRAMTIVPRLTPCLRCILPAPPASGEVGTCETVGILAPTIAHVAAFQTTEALRWLSGATPRYTSGMLVCDIWRAEFAIVLANAKPDPECASCGEHATLPALLAPPDASATLCGRDAVQLRPRGDGATPTRRLDLALLASELGDSVTELWVSDQMLRFVADGCRFSVFSDGRALVFGTRDLHRARSLYDRYLGS